MADGMMAIEVSKWLRAPEQFLWQQCPKSCYAMSRKEIIALVKSCSGMVVQSGPFAGMRLNDIQSWGNGEDIGPQLLGVYEEELHPSLNAFVAAKPTTIINIGCAEGYYAVGLALIAPWAKVFAFAIDPKAQDAYRLNAILNGVSDRVAVDAECLPARLRELAAIDSNIFALVDCEGAEKDLLTDVITVSALRRANFVVEVHDHIDRDTSASLIRCFGESHRLTMVCSGGRNPHAFPFLDRCRDIDKWLLICENRPELQHWLTSVRRSS